MIPDGMQVQLPVRQTILRGVQLEVGNTPEGGRVLVVNTPMEQIVVPLDLEVARELGHQLSAPGVVVPSPNGRAGL